MDEPDVPGRKRYRQPGSDIGALTGLEDSVLDRPEIQPCIARVCPLRQGCARMDPFHKKADVHRPPFVSPRLGRIRTLVRIDMVYRERLWPAVWVWLLGLGCAGMLAWALAFALGPLWGLLTLIGCSLLVVGGFVATLSVITVSGRGVRVDGACLSLHALLQARALEDTEMREMLRSLSEPTFLAVRPWATRSGVVLTLHDPADPHTRWLVSSRHPVRFVDAIQATLGAADRARLASGEET
jgi:hypothetical protein